MFYRPGFVTNSSSSGYYFFIPKNKEIYPEFFDEIGLTPVEGYDGMPIVSSDVYRDVRAKEKEDKKNRKDYRDDYNYEYPTIAELIDAIKQEVAIYKKDKEQDRKNLEHMKERFPDDPETWTFGGGMSTYWMASIKANTKLIRMLRQGYRLIHISYADDAGEYSASMDYNAGHGRIIEKKGVGGAVTFSYH